MLNKTIFWQHPKVLESGPLRFAKFQSFKIFKINSFSMNGLHTTAKHDPRPDLSTEFRQESNGKVLQRLTISRFFKDVEKSFLA